MAQRAPLEAVRPNRIPPHNIDAEQSVLGAMLESRDAILNVVEILGAKDFYKPAHGMIFETIVEVISKGEPADPVTVADELARKGALEQIGGKPYILGLLEAYPTASSASRYAHIVEEHALLRRLIEAGNRVQEIGFEMPENVDEAVDEAESVIYQVADRRLRDDMQPIRPLLTKTMEDLETLAELGEDVTGLASGFGDLDHFTLGFQPSTLVIIAARPAMGKCQPDSSSIVDPLTGDRMTLGEFIKRRRPLIHAMDAQGYIEPSAVTDWIPNGERECFRLTTRSGRGVEATANHPFLMATGWAPLDYLKVGDRIAIPRRVEAFGSGKEWTREKARLLAYFIAEGGLTARCPMFTNVDPVIIQDFERCLEGAFPSCETSRQGLSLRTKAKVRKRTPNDVTLWLDGLELMGKKAEHKFFPDSVWRMNREQLADFLRALFSSDGTIYSMNGYARIEFAVASEQLAEDVRHALTRFGIIAKLWRKTDRCWRVEITDSPSVDIYQQHIGWIGEKAQRVFKFREGRHHSQQGQVPAEIWDLIKKSAAEAGLSLSELSRRAGENASNPHTKRRIAQWRLAKYAEVLDSDELRTLANDDIYWDEVISIEPVGVREVYDLSVPEGSNFVANDIIVHNSSLLNDFALHAALKKNQPVVIFSLEMGRQELTQRFLASEAKIDSQKIRRGALQEQDWQRLSSAVGRLAEAPIFIDDSPNITLMEMRAKCRRLKAKSGLGMVIVDYLQLMQGPRKTENRQQEVSEISR
ncbi:MAG: DnaB-like helicase C-terminal domain-containing protein, partial [Actinomycetota bacterium]